MKLSIQRWRTLLIKAGVGFGGWIRNKEGPEIDDDDSYWYYSYLHYN